MAARGEPESEKKRFVHCPYDVSHRITEKKLVYHLLRCRHNYFKNALASHEPALLLTCKYNKAHQYPGPEIKLHESRCRSQGNLVQHLIEYVNQESGKTSRVLYFSKGHQNTFNSYLEAAKPVATKEIMVKSSLFRFLLPSPGEAPEKKVSALETEKKTLPTISEETEGETITNDKDDWGILDETEDA